MTDYLSVVDMDNITADIDSAVQLLKQGALVAFPTETVYGLGADATNPEAVEKIFKAKNRPADHPVIVHIYHENQLQDWIETIPEAAKKLIENFWPGALTLIFQAKQNIAPCITGGQPTIGIRMPSHPVARELLKAFGGAIAAPSANRFGKISPTQAAHVQEELGDKVSLILDGGECTMGIESTIIDITHSPPILLRPGPLDIAQIKQKSGVKVIAKSMLENNPLIPRVSGNLPSHYAPTTPLSLFNFPIPAFSSTAHIAVMFLHDISKDKRVENILWIKMPDNPELYAHQLYAVLRNLDKKSLDSIWVEMPPEEIIWEAIRDRLTRAAKSSGD